MKKNKKSTGGKKQKRIPPIRKTRKEIQSEKAREIAVEMIGKYRSLFSRLANE